MSFEISGGFVSKATRKPSGRGVRYTGLALPKLPGKLREAGKRGLESGVDWFQAKRMPVKFSVQAYDEYGGKEDAVFNERRGAREKDGSIRQSKAYIINGGKIRPLYSSGFLRTMILRGKIQAKATGKGSGMKVRAWWSDLPRYTFFYNPSFKKDNSTPLIHNKVAELTAMNATDIQGMGKAYEARVKKEVKKINSGGES